MALIDKKITNPIRYHQDNANTVIGQASTMKALFDQGAEDLRVKLNGVIDELLATTGAQQIGIDSTRGLGNTLADALTNIKAYMDLGASGISATTIGTGSGNTVQSQLEWLLLQIQNVLLNQIPDGTITMDKLSTTLVDLINGHTTQLAQTEIDITKHKVATTYYSDAKQPLVTFIDDDGSMAVYTRLYPIFQSKGITGNCAIITGSINKPSFMTEGNLSVLAQAGWEFLGHGREYISNLSEFTNDSDLDYQLGDGCKGWLKDRGYTVNGFVYPQGVSDMRIRRYTKKHYDFAFQGETFNTGEFLDSMRIKRIAFGSWTDTNPIVNNNSEKNTLSYYKACVDYARANNIWLVFMLHVGQQLIEQDVILGELVDYIKSQNVKIVNATDGYKTFGNNVFVGDLDGKYLAINDNGVFSNDIYPQKAIPINSKNLSDGIALYNKGISIMKVNFAHGNSQGFPGATSGTLFTYKIDDTYNIYNRQEFWQGTSNKKHVRYPISDTTWSAWEEILTSANVPYKILGVNAYAASQPITDFPENSITTFCVTFAGGLGYAPSQSAGIVTTYRIFGNGWDRQEFRKYGSNEIFARYTDITTGAWTTPVKISAV